MRRLFFLLVAGAGVALSWVAIAHSGAQEIAEPKADQLTARNRPSTRLLPGVQSTGAVQLPNQWSIRPVGRQVALGDFPVNIAVHPSGRWLAILHAGYGTHEVSIFDADKSRQKVVSRVIIDQAFYGLTFSPDGKTLYASGGELEVVHVSAGARRRARRGGVRDPR